MFFDAFGSELQIVGSGLRHGTLPSLERSRDPFEEGAEPPRPRPRTRGPARERGDDDLEAFEAAGWRFERRAELDREAMRAPGEGAPLDAGLLASSRSGRYVVLRNRAVVKLQEGVSAAAVLGRHAGYRRLGFGRDLYSVNLAVAEADLQGSIERELAALERSPEIVFAEPSILFRVPRPRRRPAVVPRSAPVGRGRPPGVEGLNEQWHWKRIGLECAWQKGGYQGLHARVGVVDFGFHLDDPQIRRNIRWTGRVTLDGERVETAKPEEMPRDWHGTFCAGLIGAIQDDRMVYGAAPRCSLSLVALPEHDLLAPEILGEALKFCAEEGCADVINCSVGVSGSSMALSRTLREAIDDVHRSGGTNARGRLIVWAVYNSDTEICEGSVEAYEPLLCVSASDQQDQRTDSGWGKGLDLLAPGIGIPGVLRTERGACVSPESGASFAAPCVAGVAALLLDANPRLTADELAEILCTSCDPVGDRARPNPQVGWGRLNAEKAMAMALDKLPPQYAR